MYLVNENLSNATELYDYPFLFKTLQRGMKESFLWHFVEMYANFDISLKYRTLSQITA